MKSSETSFINYESQYENSCMIVYCEKKGNFRNTVLLISDYEAMIVDPPLEHETNLKIKNKIKAYGCEKTHLILTHWHEGHFEGLQNWINCPVITHRQTLALLFSKGTRNQFSPRATNWRFVDEYLDIEMGAMCFSISHTPGHCIGQLTLEIGFPFNTIIASDNLIFPIPLFGHSYDKGNTIKSYLEKLYYTDENTTVIPGHGIMEVSKSDILKQIKYLEQLEDNQFDPSFNFNSNPSKEFHFWNLCQINRLDLEKRVKDLYNENACNYDIGRKKSEADAIIIKQLHKCKPRTVLDIGSGPASFWKFALKNNKLIGVNDLFLADISEKMLDKAKKNLEKYTDKVDIRFCNVSTNHIAFDSSFFDVVVAMSVMHHIGCLERKQLFDSIFRWLRNGKYFILLADWADDDCIYAPLLTLRRQLASSNGWNDIPSKTEYINELVESNFEIVSTKNVQRPFTVSSLGIYLNGNSNKHVLKRYDDLKSDQNLPKTIPMTLITARKTST